MKLLFVPLKVITEGLWLGARLVRKVVQTVAQRGDKASDIAKEYAAPDRPMPMKGQDNSAWSSKTSGSAAPAGPLNPEPEGGWSVGDKVRLSSEAKVKRFTVPAGADGRIETAEDGLYNFLWYGRDGLPVLVRKLKGSDLSGH